MAEIESKHASCLRQLMQLGKPRSSPEEQRFYLLQLSQTFQELVKAAVGGDYSNPFFQDAQTEKGYQQRIRSVIQNLNEDFATEMSLRGHHREIVVSESGGASDAPGVIKTSREDFIAHVKQLQQRTRGRELPGTFNPMIVADLFREQSRPWEAIVRRHVQKVWDAACCFVKLVVTHTADASAAKPLQIEAVEPAMARILEAMRDKTTELLKPHHNSHPITNNHSFTEALQEVRRKRQEESLEGIIKRFLRVEFIYKEDFQSLNGRYNLSGLAESLAAYWGPNMADFAANEALDCLNAYYKVAFKRFIDDVAVEVIETKLVCALDGILSPLSVYQMAPEQVARIAGESAEARTERDRLTKQVEILGNGLETCKKFAALRLSAGE
ncbi:hypothetical protein VTK26DRAFT_3002 [Humicola hyalothermophila]